MPHRKHRLFGAAMQETVLRNYSWDHFKQDAIAALVVSLVALPLAMALSIAVGLPPQHGIYTAIVAGIITPLLGGSIMQVSGPTAAFVVIIAPIVAQHGLRGIVIAQIMAGIMLLAMAKARMGRFISFVPYPVTTGFTAGIAVVIAVLALNDLFGIGLQHMDGPFLTKLSLIVEGLPSARWQEAAIGFLSLLVMFNGKRMTGKIPATILGIMAGTALGLIFQSFDVSYASIGSRFSYVTALGEVGKGIPPMLPELYHFELSPPTYAEIQALLMPAVIIAALAALESLLSASVADGLARTRHHPNSELAAIGVANIASGLFSGIPATGAIARTTTNIKSGARTPIASALHAVFILLYVLAFAPLISYIPMASLAALLIVVAYNMSHYRQFWRIVKIAPRHDVIVLLTCFVLTVLVDMVAGVSVGIMLAALLFIQKIAAATEVQVETSDSTTPNGHLPPNVVAYHIHGPLFFATVERALDRTSFLRHKIDTIIFDMEHVPLIDMTGLVAIKTLLTSDSVDGKKVIICAKPHIRIQIEQKLKGEPVRLPDMVDSVEEALAKMKAV